MFILCLFFLDFPISDSSLGTVEADTDFNQSLTFGMIRQHVAFFVYLSQSFFCTLIYLQFEDVYRIWHVHYSISPANGALHFRTDIDVEETEHQIEDSLIMLLAVILQIVWYRSHIGAHVFQCRLDIIPVNRLAEPQKEGIVVRTARIHIMGNQ